MPTMINVADLVEANGKTVRENNAARDHTVQLGALVEITTDCPIGEFGSIFKGVRMFVVAHARDCDGTPLYSLSVDRNIIKDVANEQEAYDGIDDPSLKCVFALSLGRAKGAISTGWDIGSFQVIDPAPASNVVRQITSEGATDV